MADEISWEKIDELLDKDPLDPSDCNFLREQLENLIALRRANGNEGKNQDELEEKYRPQLESLDAQLLPKAEKVQLLQSIGDPNTGAAQQAQNQQKIKADDKLRLERLKLSDEWFQEGQREIKEDWLRMLIWYRCERQRGDKRHSSKPTREDKPFFDTPHYPQVRDDPVRLFWQILRAIRH